MRSSSVFVLLVACAVLCQGLALEKKHAIKPKVVEASESLEEEESTPVEEPQLEEEEKEEEEKTAALEENSDNEAEDEDNDDNKEQERILEEHTIAANKVSSDVDRMLEALDSDDSEFSAKIVADAKSNLRAIRKDSEDLVKATGNRATNLKSAIKLRMQALRMMLNKDHETNDNKKELEASENSDKELEEEEEESPKVRSVVSDVHALTKSLEERDMSEELRTEAKANLEAIATDAKKYAKASGSRARDLKKAIGYRMKAFKMMMAESKPARATEAELEEEEKKTKAKDAKVLDDVQHLQTALKAVHLPAKAKKEARKNISQLIKDAEELSTASVARREKLTKAMKLRTQALRLQLEEH